RHVAAAYWHIPAIGFVALTLVFWFVQPDEGFVFVVRALAITVLALLLAVIVQRLAIQGFARAFRLNDDVRQRFPALELRVNRYLQVFNGVVVAAIYVFVLLAILQAWGVRSFEWLTSAAGRQVSADVGVVALTLIASLAVWESVNAV